MILQDAVLKEMRQNTAVSYIETHNIKSIEYIYQDGHAHIPKNAIMKLQLGNPSFMYSKDGKDYVLAINPFLSLWSLFEVEYIDNN